MRQHIYQANQHTHTHTHTHTNVNSLGGSDLISDDPMLMTKKQTDPWQPPQWDGPRMENDNTSI